MARENKRNYLRGRKRSSRDKVLPNLRDRLRRGWPTLFDARGIKQCLSDWQKLLKAWNDKDKIRLEKVKVLISE